MTRISHSETPHYVGRGVVALAADPEILSRSGEALTSWRIAQVLRLHGSRRSPTRLGRARESGVRLGRRLAKAADRIGGGCIRTHSRCSNSGSQLGVAPPVTNATLPSTCSIACSSLWCVAVLGNVPRSVGRRRHGASLADPAKEILGGQGAAQEVALCEGAAERGEPVPGLLRLDSFGDDIELEALRQLDHGADDRGVLVSASMLLTNVRSILISLMGSSRRRESDE